MQLCAGPGHERAETSEISGQGAQGEGQRPPGRWDVFTEVVQVCELLVLCGSAPPWDPALVLLRESEQEAGTPLRSSPSRKLRTRWRKRGGSGSGVDWGAWRWRLMDECCVLMVCGTDSLGCCLSVCRRWRPVSRPRPWLLPLVVIFTHRWDSPRRPPRPQPRANCRPQPRPSVKRPPP